MTPVKPRFCKATHRMGMTHHPKRNDDMRAKKTGTPLGRHRKGILRATPEEWRQWVRVRWMVAAAAGLRAAVPHLRWEEVPPPEGTVHPPEDWAAIQGFHDAPPDDEGRAQAQQVASVHWTGSVDWSRPPATINYRLQAPVSPFDREGAPAYAEDLTPDATPETVGAIMELMILNYGRFVQSAAAYASSILPPFRPLAAAPPLGAKDAPQ